MRNPRPQTQATLAEFPRPLDGPVFPFVDEALTLKGTGKVGWMTNGGPTRSHPSRSRPFTLEVPIPESGGELKRIFLYGAFAIWAGREYEAPGTLGASILISDHEHIVHRLDLLNGRHYHDAFDLQHAASMGGDGTERSPMGSVEIDGREVRVDCLSVELPPGCTADQLKFRDMGSVASFVLFDIAFEFEGMNVCPFHSKGGGVSLSELGSIVRIGDRLRLQRAVSQLEEGIKATPDLDDARGEALTFLAVLTAGMLEIGGSRKMHRYQLLAARRMEEVSTQEDVARVAAEIAGEIVAPLFTESSSPAGQLVDQALAFVERHFARPLTDAEVAEQLGLSTSHFRFLFREATGQPFHKYLVAIRLERARRMLIDQGMPVSEVAKAVGFQNASHFSRAFAQRFNVSPARVRQISG